jgi:hypothetical protein
MFEKLTPGNRPEDLSQRRLRKQDFNQNGVS